MNKTIGILGGMSVESTQVYYRTLCEIVRSRYGGLVSPEVLIRSVNFAKYEALMQAGDWDAIGAELNREALSLERGGAELIIIATNTMHRVIDAIERGLKVPILHIADATAEALTADGRARPALIATEYVMSESFYTDRLRARGLAPLLPDQSEFAEMSRIIFGELCRGEVREQSRQFYLDVARNLKARGADSLILGCTEHGMLINAENSPLPVYNTTYIHCQQALAATLPEPA